MIDPPYRTVAVASTFSPRFLQVLAEGKRIRDRLCRQMHLIYVGKCDEETTRRFGDAFLQLKLPSESIIHYQEGDPAVAILAVAAEHEIDLLVAGALEKEAVLRPFLGTSPGVSCARRRVR
jgi:nucleotide-binding universal stress UspA family protein